ncbi:2-hydroxyacyl-CoA dehydratase [Selenomonadales bacterium OttesenSCG-928-I06]|nr:2-hydroxyacyl-CoA dehydratase [Selenomonadales bacterium OttesenSCG-928-I06]
MNRTIRIGVDIGSTTIKVVAIDEHNNIIFQKYLRHFSNVVSTLRNVVDDVHSALAGRFLSIAFTGSAGMGLSEKIGHAFVQEVVACTHAVKQMIPHTDTVIELGGEDAKITYFGATLEQRMNGVCAGGTGAFIDQMAVLLNTDPQGLNELAKNYKTIYPVASRCGVFAKTDIQNLMNEGASKEDIAASIFQAVVNQTIGSLAQGRPIKGRVAFLGGPLHFLPELRKRFIETLNLTEEQVITPKEAQYFVALGAAMSSGDKSETVECMYDRFPLELDLRESNKELKLEPLFKDKEDYLKFKNRHEENKIQRKDLATYEGRSFLGIDAGSTTSKLVLLSEAGELLYSYYNSNCGKPLESVVEAVKELYTLMNNKTVIAGAAVTGYGENLIKSALRIDIGEVETVAHLKAAKNFQPDVTFVLDIGGQDMKSFFVKDGVIDNIMLNEACSSGCGSFIETFAQSNSMAVEDFAQVALKAKQPVDLGTRCTVFINSKVKQAQKEGIEIEDISAGLAISVVKNALFKVIRLKDVKELGDKIVVQGGTFKNDAVLRSLEMLVGVDVIRPDIAGLMGAYGAALIAQERCSYNEKSTIIEAAELAGFSTETKTRRCNLCTNRCLITTRIFSNGSEYSSGNRCERGVNIDKVKNDLPDLYAYKNKRLFSYKPKPIREAKRGKIGIIRALNMFEDYPFWFTFFNELDYRVVLSDPTSEKTYTNGMDTIPSETVCYPAKLAHGHIVNLVEKGVPKIFYPCIPYNICENSSADNCYNCPVVTSYPETIDGNMEILEERGVRFYKPFLPINDPKRMAERLFEELQDEHITKKEIKAALEKAYKELYSYKKDVQDQGSIVVDYIKNNNLKAVVLAGRPYHIDPKINHGFPELLKSYGFAVLSEDAVNHLGDFIRPLRVVDQWMYHSRLYNAAAFSAKEKNFQLVQITSFGCGLDAVTTDQAKEITEHDNKIYTCVKFDEINNIGSVRIRIRSLLAAILERENFDSQKPVKLEKYKYDRVHFTKEMAQKHTILAPQMSPIHFQFLENCFKNTPYNIVIPEIDEKEAIVEGLKYIHNDACYPCIIVTGHLLTALKSGKYDINNTSVILSQTCGGCRATNYIPLMRKALTDAGLPDIPVLSIWGEKSSGFKLNMDLIRKMILSVLYGDLLMQLTCRTRPYEKEKGQIDALYKKWVEKCINDPLKRKIFKKNICEMIREFDNIELDETIKKPRVGIVGEILVKFHPGSNNHIVETLEREGAEVVIPDMFSFFQYSLFDNITKHKLLSGSFTNRVVADFFIATLNFLRKDIKNELKNSKRFFPLHDIKTMAKKTDNFISVGNMTGEGWFLVGEMLSLLEDGVDNVVCLQPFGCLPNHIIGKGIIKKIRKSYPKANIVPLDFDPGISSVNQLNRIKLMLSAAKTS